MDVRFERDPIFDDQLATVVRSAPLRQVFVEQSIERTIRRALDPDGPLSPQPTRLHLDEGFGLLPLEAPFAGVPSTLVSFTYQESAGTIDVTLFRIRLAPERRPSID